MIIVVKEKPHLGKNDVKKFRGEVKCMGNMLERICSVKVTNITYHLANMLYKKCLTVVT